MPGNRLTLEERVWIEARWTGGGTIPAIAEALGRHRSTVWRELGRNHAYRHGPKNPRGAQLPRNRKSHYA